MVGQDAADCGYVGVLLRGCRRAFQPLLTPGLPWKGIVFPSTKERSHGTQAESINGGSVA